MTESTVESSPKVRLMTRGSDYSDQTPLNAIRIVDGFVRGLPESALRLHDDEVKDAFCSLYDQDLPTYDLYRGALARTGDRTTLRLVEEIVSRARRTRVSLPVPIDLHALASREPDAPRHVLPGWLPEGEVTLLGGHGGSGKSAIALDIACCIALGIPWCGLQASPRKVYFFSAEDSQDILHWRLARICGMHGVKLSDLNGVLRIIDASGIDPELMVLAGREEDPQMTGLYDALADRVEPNSVIIIDGASDTYGASEIVRRHVRRFIRALRRLAGDHGAVLLLAHVDKAAARSKDSGDRYSGSTAWHNSVRARWELQPDGDELVLRLAKANHARAGAEIRLRWDAEAHMHVPGDPPGDGGIVASIRERSERDAVLTALRGCMRADPPIPVPSAPSGQRTTWHVLSERPEFPAALRSDDRTTRKRFYKHIEQLRQSGAIEEQSVLTSSRHRAGILVAREVRES
jgi:hypothetical protein